MTSQKNNTLNLLKLLAAYMVVFIHILFPGDFGYAMNSIGRFAVPFFFLVSGFYSYNIDYKRFKKRILSLLHLLAFSFIVYTVLNVVFLVASGNMEAIAQYFHQYLSLRTWFDFIVLNQTVSSGHLWYLVAMIYVYLAFYLIAKYKINERIIFILSFALIAVRWFLGEGILVFGVEIPAFYLRNFLLMGIPFFAIGMLVRKYEDKVKRIPLYAVLISITVGVAATLLSRFIIGKNELYLGSLFILFATVVIFIKYSGKSYPKFLIMIFECSTYIYILHLAIGEAMTIIYSLLGIHNSIIAWINPILVCLISTVCASLLNWVAKRIRKNI